MPGNVTMEPTFYIQLTYAADEMKKEKNMEENPLKFSTI